MPIDNAFATHPGKAAEASEKKNEDFAHAWVKDAVSYQIIADGNGRSDILNLPHLQSMRSNALLTAIRSRE